MGIIKVFLGGPGNLYWCLIAFFSAGYSPLGVRSFRVGPPDRRTGSFSMQRSRG